MRHPPKLSYNGITIVLANPSRFDSKQLLTGWAGVFLNEECLNPYTNRYQCDIRTSNTLSQGILSGTKGLLLVGERAFKEWTGGLYDKYTLDEQRGYLLESSAFKDHKLAIVASYFPQDCMDIVDHEGEFNKQNYDHTTESGYAKESAEASEKRRHGRTARSNYRFWLQEDVKKLLELHKHYDKDWDTYFPSTSKTEYVIYPKAGEAIAALRGSKGQCLYLDIETDSNYNILCFSFSFGVDRVYTVPLIRFDYTSKAYQEIEYAKIIQALVVAMRDNTTVCHNALFDLLILAWKYSLPIGFRNYDTMLAHHRCYPEAEKSLGHAISHLTMTEKYHKDEGIFSPRNPQQEWQLWKYNARDVSSMILVKEAIDRHARRIPGLPESIAQANSMVRPYLITTLLGIRFNEERRREVMRENDLLMTHYMRAINILTGGLEVLPTSSKQCHRYFHSLLGYKVQNWSTHDNPSWNEEALRKLKLQYPDNPVIDFALAFRSKSKESGTLKAEPWMKGAEEVCQ